MPKAELDILAEMGFVPNHSYHRLEGGARLLTSELRDRASVSLVLMFGVGSRFEEDRVGGISHFIEHLLFKGTHRRPSSKDIAEAVEGVGGVLNAWTDKEATSYWARVPVEQFELAADVLFDLVSGSKLDPADIERERMVILEELKMYLDQPQDRVSSSFEQMMWPDHPLGRDVIGTAGSISGLTREDLSEHIGRYYGVGNLVVGVCGGVDSDHALRVVEAHLPSSSSPNGTAVQVGPGALARGAVSLQRKDTEQAHICLGTRALSYLDPKRYALDLLSTILGEGMSSRLFLDIREKRGLAYDVHSYTSKHRDSGYFAVYLGVDPAKAVEALRAVVPEVRQLAETRVPEVELAKAKEYTKGRLRLGLESTNSVASWLCQQELLMGEVKTVDQVVAMVDAVSAEGLREVAEQVFLGPLQLAVIGPFESDEPFRAAIG